MAGFRRDGHICGGRRNVGELDELQLTAIHQYFIYNTFLHTNLVS